MNIIDFSKQYIWRELAKPNSTINSTELLHLQRTLSCIHSENVARAYLEICSKRKSLCNDYREIASGILRAFDTLDKLSINDYLLEIDNAVSRAYDNNNKNLRLGQCIFNECYALDFLSDFIDKHIRGTNKDCFYNDDNITKFIDTITSYILWNLKQVKNIISLMMVKYHLVVITLQK